MNREIVFDIQAQPDDITCGPTSLHAIYQYYNDDISLQQVIREANILEEGGTLGVFLAIHALKRGYKSTIYTYNLEIFDPSWFYERANLKSKLLEQRIIKKKRKLQIATEGYLEFLELGGKIRYQILTRALLRKYLNRNCPILTGLSATYLYQSKRELPVSLTEIEYDDIKGYPSGHFVVLCGYDKKQKLVTLADPLKPNPISNNNIYQVNIDHLINSILLGILTYDANFILIEP